MARKSSTPEDMARRLEAWRGERSQDPRIVAAIEQPSVMGDLAGQMFVTNIEVGQRKVLLAESVRPAFLDLPYQEALDFWVEQGGNPAMLARVLRHYRTQAGTASDLLLDTASKEVMLRIDSVLSDGGTLKDFTAQVQSDQANLGLTPADSTYLQTVFRTNVQTAYGAGRFRQMTDPNVIAARPYVQYRTAEDNRVRASHAVLNGLIFDAAGDQWHSIAPPNGYNCRCSVVTLSEDDYIQERRNGNVTLNELPPGSEPDEGFDGPPTQVI